MTTTTYPRLRPQLITDAVVAGYIHHISARHERDGRPSQAPARSEYVAEMRRPDVLPQPSGRRAQRTWAPASRRMLMPAPG